MLRLWLTGPNWPSFLKTRNSKTEQQDTGSICITLTHSVCPEAKTELLDLSLIPGNNMFYLDVYSGHRVMCRVWLISLYTPAHPLFS